MAIIRPFKGIRPAGERANEIAALPYDVYNRAEAKEEVKKNPLSFLKIDRAETNFDDDVDIYDPCVYQKAHDILWQMVDEGYFVRDTDDYYYVYELTMNHRIQTGIVACASICDYENQIIKKHENTRADKELDRIAHVDTVNAQTGPIFLAYRAKKTIDTIVDKTKQQEAIYDFTADDRIRHRVFIIHEKEDIKTLREAFASMDSIYIADGHHRAASAVKVGQRRRNAHGSCTGEEEFLYFLSVLFPDDQLMIMDYNRVIKDLNGLDSKSFMTKIREFVEILDSSQEELHPVEKGQFAMYFENTWYLCGIRETFLSDDPVEGLDVSILQKAFLEPVLGIEDPKTSSRIDFVGGIRGYQELERRCHDDSVVAFGMYPTSILELFAVADANLLMPPKSTWFEPKLRSGLFIHELDQ